MRIVMFASGAFAIPTLRALAHPDQRQHELVCLISQPDRGTGRGRRTHPTPARQQAIDLGIETIAADDVNEPQMRDRIASYNADLGLVIAFGQKIGGDVRGLFRHQCVNLHASLLPAYRGAAPFQWAIINGEQRTGVTVFRLVDRMDAGPVYATRWTYIKPEERACELHDRLAAIGVDAMNATLEALDADPPAEPIPQDDSQATYAPKLSVESARIDWANPAERPRSWPT